MQYVALLRGINVGGNHKVEMVRLKRIFESLGCLNVTTYLNSGNVIFKSNKKSIQNEVPLELKKEFGFDIPVLIKTIDEIKSICKAIPKDWQNDTEWKCDVAYLFTEIDSRKTIEELPVKKEFIDIRYTEGAIYWLVNRKNYNKSHINKIISHRYYQLMTVRNVNTARFLAQ